MIPEEIVRRERLHALREAGVDPYPRKAERTHKAKEVLGAFEELDKQKTPVTVAGRIRAIRKHGGLTFLRLQDDSETIQIVLHRDELGVDAYEEFHKFADVGDFYSVHGVTFVTKRGEKSVDARKLSLLTKSLLPLPEKWHGLTDSEKRFRKRYLDLISNEPVKEIFKLRSNVVHAIRSFLHEEGFMEVETPILQPMAGGAEAKPFVTHHNALDADLFLRIAPELYLKRCLVGGFEKVFEIARCFRNEGISFQHNPEFTQVECYWAYADRDMMIDHLERLLVKIVTSVTGGETKIEHQGDVLDFSAPMKRMSFYDLIEAETGINLSTIKDEDELKKVMKSKGMDCEGIIGFGELADEIWKRHVRPSVQQPTFVIDYPAAMKPLAKRNPDHPERSSNVQLLVKGMEVMNGFDELNDPLEQEERFNEQEKLRERGSEAAHSVDHDYVEALKIGMPPAAGYGIGIDRLCTLLTNVHNIKEVILFPTLRPIETEEKEEDESAE